MVRSSLLAVRVQQKKRGRRRWVVAVVVLAGLVWGANYVISHPVATALAADPRTATLGLAAHLRYYVDPTTVVLNLDRAPTGDPVDLFRGVLVAGAALRSAAWILQRVVLTRDGTPVYRLSIEDFDQLAHDYGVSRRPVAVVLSLVQKLRLPGGQPLPATTVEDAASHWGAGRP